MNWLINNIIKRNWAPAWHLPKFVFSFIWWNNQLWFLKYYSPSLSMFLVDMGWTDTRPRPSGRHSRCNHRDTRRRSSHSPRCRSPGSSTVLLHTPQYQPRRGRPWNLAGRSRRRWRCCRCRPPCSGTGRRHRSQSWCRQWWGLLNTKVGISYAGWSVISGHTGNVLNWMGPDQVIW